MCFVSCIFGKKKICYFSHLFCFNKKNLKIFLSTKLNIVDSFPGNWAPVIVSNQLTGRFLCPVIETDIRISRCPDTYEVMSMSKKDSITGKFVRFSSY